MGKNNKLINQMRALGQAHQEENIKKAAKEMTPTFYAAMALVLHRYFGFGQERTAKAFQKTFEIWQEHEGRGEELVKECEEELGIKIIND